MTEQHLDRPNVGAGFKALLILFPPGRQRNLLGEVRPDVVVGGHIEGIDGKVGSPMGVPKRKLPSALAANVWKPGQSGNPTGHSGLYGETVKLAREASPAAMRRLIELMSSEDERVASVASNSILDRAFGKPRDYDPLRDPEAKVPFRFDPSRLSPEELATVEAALRLMLKTSGVDPGLALYVSDG